MKGDFTRFTFDQKKHYSSVRLQQGRVQLDADYNEQLDITVHRVETETRDVIGPCGGPLDGAGFALQPQGNQLQISAGRYYVDGILCENEPAVLASAQPDLPPNAPIVKVGNSVVPLPPPAGVYLVYLDVWTRHITALEDPSIREVALGGPDTGTRTKTVWQVKFLRVGNLGANINCSTNLPAWNTLIEPPNGKLSARAQPTEAPDTPCDLTPGAGFRRLENQLYRVEVHKSGTLNTATFKWSRDNGSIVTEWLAQSAGKDELTVANPGHDKVRNFASGQWVELTDDTHEQLGEPGTLVKLKNVEGQVLTIDPTTAIPNTPSAIDKASFPRNPKIRRWDSEGALDIKVPGANDGFLPLESGVEVKFTTGSYRSGDYWLIPARTATRTTTGDVEWPKTAANLPADLSPHGIEHHYCRLGLVTFDAGVFKSDSVVDCRCLFPSLTQVPALFYVSGDGQEAMPDLTQPTSLVPLPNPLVVGVVNAHCRDQSAKVRFKIVPGKGDGKVMPHGGAPVGAGKTIDIPTDEAGLASCDWHLDATTWSQQVEATLLDANDQPIHLPIRFNANLSIAGQVAYESGQCLVQAVTVKEALDQLCQNITLYCVCGDGQEAMPGDELAAPLQVRVANGRWPKAGARVRFSIAAGNGTLLASPGFPTVPDAGGLIVTANNDGLAQCRWQLGNNPVGQKVEATLLDVDPVVKLCFNANLSLASQVSYTPPADCQELQAVKNVQEAIDALCRQERGGGCTVTVGRGGQFERLDQAIKTLLDQGQTDICLCLLPGNHVVGGLEMGGPQNVNIKIVGCGSGTRIGFRDQPWFLRGIASFTLREVEVNTGSLPQPFVFEGCDAVTVASCRLVGVTNQGALLTIGGADRIHLENNTIEAYVSTGFDRIINVTQRIDAAIRLPGTAIVIMDGNADTVIETNNIVGAVSLYGMPGPGDLTRDEWKRLQGRLRFFGAREQLQILNNRLTRLRIGAPLIEKLRALLPAGGGGTLEGLYKVGFLNENMMEVDNNQLVAQYSTLDSNFFNATSLAGVVVADAATYTGNNAFSSNVLLLTIAPVASQAANVITITPP